MRHRTGYCYAKAHLLAALLRANGIAAGLCYQRLSLNGDNPPYCLHGLIAAYLRHYGWYRIDPRGDKADVDARFDPPREYLAFQLRHSAERDFTKSIHSPCRSCKKPYATTKPSMPSIATCLIRNDQTTFIVL